MALTVGVDTYVDAGVGLLYIQQRYTRIAAIQSADEAAWEGALLRACDAIEGLEPAMWQGWKTTVTSPLQWPRVAVVDHRAQRLGLFAGVWLGFFDANSMPDLLQYAQAEEALLLYLLDANPGYVPRLLDEQKGVSEERLQLSRLQYQQHRLHGDFIRSMRAWLLLLQLRRDKPARVVMC